VIPLPSGLPVLNSEPPALDLVNTHLVLADTWVDLLEDSAGRTEWLAMETERMGLDVDPRTLTDADWRTLQELRDHAAATIEAARHEKRPPRRAVSALNDVAAAAPAASRARWDGTRLVAAPHRSGPVGSRVAAGFADAAVELLTSPNILKVRRCEAPACVVRFLARNPRRRWCTPEICGNRARVARYYMRRKAEANAR